MMATDRAAWAGCPGSSDAAASAWTAIRLTWCATTSCSSRAMVTRSRAAARADCRSISASARSARLSAARRFACRARLSTPAAAAVRKMNACVMASYGSLWPGADSETETPATTNAPTIHRHHALASIITVYSAIAGPSGNGADPNPIWS